MCQPTPLRAFRARIAAINEIARGCRQQSVGSLRTVFDSFRLIHASIVVLVLNGAAALPVAAESVEFDSLDGKIRLQAELRLPQTDPPHRAIVFLHGCSGLKRNGVIRATYSAWGKLLNDTGFAVLMVDSAAPRGFGSTCGPSEARKVMYFNRPLDAYGALDYLQSRPDIRADGIGLAGWSQGGGIALLTIVSNSIGRPDPPPEQDFKAAIAFYPSACSTRAQSRPFTAVEPDAWSTSIPLLVLHGAKDNWARVEPCRQFINAARQRQQPVAIQIYSEAAHSFDAPNLRLQRRSLPVLADGTRPLIGTNDLARADARRRVPAHFEAHIAAD